MLRAVLLLSSIALLVGCQANSPFTAFGPPTVPAPASNQTPPYYPPTAKQPSSLNSQSASTRPSVSAEISPATPPPPRSPTIIADASDREPIRIVENPTPTRTATAPSRGQSLPSAQPARPSATPPNPLPGSPPATAPQSRLRSDSSVVPASHQQSAPAFSETPKANGTWRAR